MINHIAAIALFALVTASSAFGQTTPPVPPVPPQAPARATQPAPPPPPPAPPAPPVRRLGQAVNVKVDVTITDQSGMANALKKTMTVVTADGLSGYVRSQASYTGLGEMPLNIDVEPALLQNGRILLSLNLQYDLPAITTFDDKPPAAGTSLLRRTVIRESLSLVLDSGKPMIAAQSADPVGDRQVTVEVTATILK